MGLGVLFFGYVLVSIFTFAPTYFITDLVGSFVMYEALVKLRPHAKRFEYAIYAVYALFTVSAVQCFYYTLSYVGLINGVLWLEHAIEICRLAVMFVYTVVMLLALRELALSVGDEKLGDKCKRNVWLYCVNYAFIISLSLDFDFLAGYISAFSAFALLYKLLCVILICANIFSCYMWICLESDHDMNPKEKKTSGLGQFFEKVKNGGSDDITKEELEKVKTEKRSEKGNNKKKK